MAVAKGPQPQQQWAAFGNAKRRFGARDKRYDDWDWLMELGQKMIDEGMQPRDIQAISQGLAQLATVITGLVLENRGRSRNKKLFETDFADETSSEVSGDD